MPESPSDPEIKVTEELYPAEATQPEDMFKLILIGRERMVEIYISGAFIEDEIAFGTFAKTLLKRVREGDE